MCTAKLGNSLEPRGRPLLPRLLNDDGILAKVVRLLPLCSPTFSLLRERVRLNLLGFKVFIFFLMNVTLLIQARPSDVLDPLAMIRVL